MDKSRSNTAVNDNHILRMRNKRAFTIREVSMETTLSLASVRNRIKDGSLKAKQLGRRIVILAEDLDQFLGRS